MSGEETIVDPLGWMLRLPEVGLTNEQTEKLFEIVGVDAIYDGDEIVGFGWPQPDE